MKVSDFHFDLPDEQIARYPLAERSASRLMHLPVAGEGVIHRRFRDLVDLLRPGDLLVFNNTRVLPARLFGRKQSGGQLELLIERVTGECEALSHIRASKAPKPGSQILVGTDRGVELEAEVLGRDGALFQLRFGQPVISVLEHYGHMPLPPYIDRADEQADQQRYQTVYAERPGAVAAPTAGLHFDDVLLQQLAAKGVEFAHVTLHVGAGTFQPVKVEQVEDHHMHAEWIEVGEAVCAQVQRCRARGGRVVAVGTTSVRSLESAAAGGALRPFSGDTRIFIYPGYRFRVVDAIITNFHLPESTLLMLVSAFAGRERVLAAYQEAVREGYRFFSYGDAMFIEGPQA